MSAEEGQSLKAREHADAQRHRILDAAEHCFIEHGFHAASMANISEKARMSAGLIYRYFENKNAIILAIIERQLQERRADISTLQTTCELAERIVDLFRAWIKRDGSVMNAALFLEMSAEATREPQIARALANADLLNRRDFLSWFKKTAEDQGAKVTEAELQQRSFALQCFVEGLAIRAVREPDTDPAMVIESMKLFLPHLLSFRKE